MAATTYSEEVRTAAYDLFRDNPDRFSRGSYASIGKSLEIPRDTIAYWARVDGWKERYFKEYEGIRQEATKVAAGVLSANISTAADRLIQVIKTGADRDALKAIELLWSRVWPIVAESTTAPATYVDKQVVLALDSLSSDELLSRTAAMLQTNITERQNERVTKRQRST